MTRSGAFVEPRGKLKGCAMVELSIFTVDEYYSAEANLKGIYKESQEYDESAKVYEGTIA